MLYSLLQTKNKRRSDRRAPSIAHGTEACISGLLGMALHPKGRVFCVWIFSELLQALLTLPRFLRYLNPGLKSELLKDDTQASLCLPQAEKKTVAGVCVQLAPHY